MQRESLLTTSRDRLLTNEISMVLGATFENIARVCGSTAHFYRNLELGEVPGAVRVNPNEYNEEFT